jgi:lipopolysaccharide/colanic/teichoic acid biosynthesis glycosyltransferase
MVFVGDGVKRPALAARAESLGLRNVRFLPYQPKEALRDSFGTADVFVVSLKRGLAGYIVPSKLYGILAAGRPYVAMVEEESEVVAITRKFECGLLVEPGDARGLAERVLSLQRDPELAARMGANARRAALEFDRPIQVRAYHDLFGELLRERRAAAVARPRRVKRAFDLLLSGVGLLLSAPLWALIALAVKLEDGGPVFFRQDRVGKGGRSFTGWKFRSMVPDAEQRFGPRQAVQDDPRVTRIGRLLRATAMDELPQLWNIWRGDMSFVGPRALRPGEIHARGDGRLVPLESVPGYRDRHAVSPGLTGLAQIYADRDAAPREKFRFDRLYIDRRGFWLDLRLILLSFWITFRGRWERRGRKL